VVVLADTGVLFGGADRDDPRHGDCVEVLNAHSDDLAVVVPVVVEACWLIETRLGAVAEAGFLRSVNLGELARVDLVDDDWARVVELIGTYADLGLGVVDASVIAVAERLGITTIATLDRRHFIVVRPLHANAFELIP
jgi:uncharacterized protein